MALPVDLTAGWVSITLQVSPNGITQGADSIGFQNFGIISACIPSYRPELEIGQYVMFKTTDKQVSVQYGVDTYLLVDEWDIIFIEQLPV